MSRPSRPPGPVSAVSSESSPALLRKLLDQSLISAEGWQALSEKDRDRLKRRVDPHALLEGLVEVQLLTDYQASRISVGKTFGLILGNYRVLDRLGIGGMGVVYKAEHMLMRRLVAVKVLTNMDEAQDDALVMRFLQEMRAVAQLRHPNIVAAIDGGTARSTKKDGLALYYFVMEYLRGQDLESHVAQNGPMEANRACDLIYQVASALDEANKHALVHRDIKPSNVLLTEEGEAKLLDFGLAMHYRKRMTEPGTVLGTIDYIAPEQARDATAVDIRADIYSLGGTLFYCLTGREPFPSHGSVTQDIITRMTQPAPSLRTFRPDLTPELDEVVARMMALNPADRYVSPQAVMRALLLHISAKKSARSAPALGHSAPRRDSDMALRAAGQTLTHRVLVVDDDAGLRQVCMHGLKGPDIECESAANGVNALDALASAPFDLVLLDYNMHGLSGLDVLKQLRTHPPCPNLKVIMFSGHLSTDQLAALMDSGVDDFVRKPFTVLELRSRVKMALRLKDAQDRSEGMAAQMRRFNQELEQNLSARDSDLVHTRNALVLALAKLVEHRNTETGAHLLRIQRYCRSLADEAAQLPAFSAIIDRQFTDMLECCAPLHDIGKVALPDHILMKPGKLTEEERLLMQEHTIIGASTLQAVARQHGSAVAFLGMGVDVARHHHERYDGNGYPDRLAGDSIPLSARLVALADVYDALRSRRVYKPALSHNAALTIMLRSDDGHFDPALLPVLERCAPRWDGIFRDCAD